MAADRLAGDDLLFGEVVLPSESPPKYGLYPKPEPDQPATGWEAMDAVELYGFVTNQDG